MGRKEDSQEGVKGAAKPGNQRPLLALQGRCLPGKKQTLLAAFLDQKGAKDNK